MLKLVVHVQAAQVPQVCVEDHNVGPQVPGGHLQVLKTLQGQHQRESQSQESLSAPGCFVAGGHASAVHP